jgi:hypothetical protein
MADAIFIAVICAFFALCVVYIQWCDRIIGPDGAPALAVSSMPSDTDTPATPAIPTVPTVDSAVTV